MGGHVKIIEILRDSKSVITRTVYEKTCVDNAFAPVGGWEYSVLSWKLYMVLHA